MDSNWSACILRSYNYHHHHYLHTPLHHTYFSFGHAHQQIFIYIHTGGLWLAACNAVVKMATLLEDTTIATHYKDVIERGRKVYIHELWNGKYFNYDSSDSIHHDRCVCV